MNACVRPGSPKPGQSIWTGADATVTDMLVSMKADENARARSSQPIIHNISPLPRSVSPLPAQCAYTDNITSLKASAKALPPEGNDAQQLVKELRKVITCEETFLEQHSVFLLLRASKVVRVANSMLSLQQNCFFIMHSICQSSKRMSGSRHSKN